MTPGNGQVTVTWSASSPAPTNYTVNGSPGGTCTTSSLTCTITGLTNGTAYTFTVTATYGLGTVTSAASSPVTPVGPPSAPTGVSATAGNGQATVSWTAPSSTGGAAITSYTATSSPDGLTCSTSSTSCTVTGLTNFTGYTFTVTATNAASLTSPPSSASSSVTPLPSKPVISTVTAGNGQVTVTWNASSPAPTNYTVNGSPGGTCTTSSLTCTITGLTNGTPYTFTVTANYPDGTTVSAPSSAVTPEAPTPPDPPTNVTGTAANGSVVVSWSAPGNPGTESLKPQSAATITGYTATASPGGATCTTTGATTCTITGLTNFTAFTFTVTATNSAGLSSSPSAESPSVTPVPTAPAITNVTGGDGSATITWSAADPAPLSYTVTGTPSGTCSTTTATTCTITGLTDGTSYTFTVTATYDGGTVGSAPSAAVVPAIPTTTTTSTPAPTSTTAGAEVSGSNATTAVATTGSLPITGSSSGFLVELAGLCILAGLGVARRHPPSSGGVGPELSTGSARVGPVTCPPMARAFPEGFRWGTATAAHQVEGGNVNNDWWEWEQPPDSGCVEPSGDACDQYHRYPADLDLLAALGFNSYRFSIEWSRIEPEEGQFSRRRPRPLPPRVRGLPRARARRHRHLPPLHHPALGDGRRRLVEPGHRRPLRPVLRGGRRCTWATWSRGRAPSTSPTS